MSLSEYLGWGPVTHRQHEVSLQWLQDEWNRPTKSDYYMMQIACEARRAICKNPRDPKISDFRIPFELQGQRPKKRTNFKAQGLKGPYVPITGDEPKDGGEVGRWAQQVWKGRVMHGSIPVEETEDGQFEVTKGAKRGKVEPTPPRRTAMSELKEWEEKQQRQRDGEE